MATNLTAVKGTLHAVGNRVLVRDMYFGEQTTKSGLIIKDDNGSTRGIYPRWGKVYAKGPENSDEYSIGNWILIEHGRWTRGIALEQDDGEKIEVRMVETESILAYSNEKPSGLQIGAEFSDGAHATIDAGAFINQ